MTDQPSITGNETKLALEQYFGQQLSNLACEIFYLRKQNRQQAELIQQLTANEAALVERIQDLEAEILLSNINKPLSPEGSVGG